MKGLLGLLPLFLSLLPGHHEVSNFVPLPAPHHDVFHFTEDPKTMGPPDHELKPLKPFLFVS
jgi:hypothetical protein